MKLNLIKQITDPFYVLAVGFIAFLWFGILGVSKRHPTGFLKDIKNRIQYLPEDSIQTSVQEYFASQSASYRNPFEKEEKRACLYSVRSLESVIPTQA